MGPRPRRRREASSPEADMTISRAGTPFAPVTVLAAMLLTGALSAGVSIAAAKDDGEWSFKKNVIGKGGETAKDVSGIACATTDLPRVCVIADDETPGAQVVILRDRKLIAGEFIRLIKDVFDKKPLDLDAEGVAYADGSFYVIGSHGQPRHPKDP